MRTDRFPMVNDVMLAEALRQLLPVAEIGVRTVPLRSNSLPFRRAEMLLNVWAGQARGRERLLDGEIPNSAYFGIGHIIHDDNDPGQTVPGNCERPSRPRSTAKRKLECNPNE